MCKEHFRTDDGKIVSLDLNRFVSAEIHRADGFSEYVFGATPVVEIRQETYNPTFGSRIQVKTEHPEKLTEEIYKALQEYSEQRGSSHREHKSGEEEG